MCHQIAACTATCDCCDRCIHHLVFPLALLSLDMSADFVTHTTHALQAALQNRAGIFIKNNYEVTINAGYNHAFALCLVIIMNAYYHSDVNTLLVAH